MAAAKRAAVDLPYAPYPSDSFGRTGPSIMFTLLSTFGLGVVLVLSVLYFRFYPRDKAVNRVLIGTLALLTTAETALQCSRTVRVGAVYGGNWTAVVDIGYFPEIPASLFLSLFENTLCLAFMVYRIVRFAWAMRPTYSRAGRAASDAAALLLVFGCVAYFAVGLGPPVIIATAGEPMQTTRQNSGNLHYPAALEVALNVQIGVSLVMDLATTAAMTWQYRGARTGFGMSNSVLGALTTIVVRNGLVVLVVQAVQVGVNDSLKAGWFFEPYIIMSKIRILTVLAIIVGPRETRRAFHAAERAAPAGAPSALSALSALTGSGSPIVAPSTHAHAHALKREDEPVGRRHSSPGLVVSIARGRERPAQDTWDVEKGSPEEEHGLDVGGGAAAAAARRRESQQLMSLTDMLR